MTTVLLILLLFPLGGSVANAVIGRAVPRRVSEAIACIGVLGALVMAVIAMIMGGGGSHHLVFWRWITVGPFTTVMDVYYNPLAAVMTLMVTFVSSLIHLYSVAFMRHEDGYVRYFCWLNLFVFAMLLITLADNLLFVYLGWEGVGFCSYALIGYWYRDLDKATAGRKAFIMTRIGDVAFGIAIALFYYYFTSFSLTYINANAATLSETTATILALLLLWAAMGKSAQLPLTVWLPDAMAGPTPVSALIHAATMVTAGVYLLMRLFPLVALSPLALMVIAGVGAVTTLYASCAALTQVDIKKVLAYSTISQVGYMILGVGAGDIVGGMYHLLCHAFFKALLFLGAGIVIQACAEEHSIFKMGNLRRLLPQVFWPFLIGALSLSAFPLIGGFFSKDRILVSTFIHPELIYKAFWAIAFLAALLTPVYTFRMFFYAFNDRPDGRTPEQMEPYPRFMVWVIWPLAILAFTDALLNLPFGPGTRFLAHFLASVPGARVDLGASAAVEWGLGLSDAVLVLLVLGLTWVFFRRPWTWTWESIWETLYQAFYLDWLYLHAIAYPYVWLAGILWQDVDEAGFDQGYTRTAASFITLSRYLGWWATGELSTYVRMLLFGVTALALALAAGWAIR